MKWIVRIISLLVVLMFSLACGHQEQDNSFDVRVHEYLELRSVLDNPGNRDMVPRLNGNNGTTFETCYTYHMFRVMATSPTTTLEIKVTDRFGNVSTETMTRPKEFTTDIYKSDALI